MVEELVNLHYRNCVGKRSIGALTRPAELLSSHRLHATGGLTTVTVDELERGWEALRKRP
jgi:hypothetical protein